MLRKCIDPIECKVTGKEIKLYLDFENYIKWNFNISKDKFNTNNRGYSKIRVKDQTGKSQKIKVNRDNNNPALKKFLKEREKMVIERLLNDQFKGGCPLLSKDFNDRYTHLLYSFKSELEKRDDIYDSDEPNN